MTGNGTRQRSDRDRAGFKMNIKADGIRSSRYEKFRRSKDFSINGRSFDDGKGKRPAAGPIHWGLMSFIATTVF
jgi:hypothetical protein